MPLFLREIFNADLSVSGVAFSLLFGWFVYTMFSRYTDIGKNKDDNKNLNSKLDVLIASLTADKKTIDGMKESLDGLKADVKDRFTSLEGKIQNAFEDLHKIKNAMQVESGNNQMNRKEIERLTAKLEKIEEQLIEFRAVENYRRSGHNRFLNQEQT